MLANWSLRSKFIVVVSLPLAVLLVFAGLAINARFEHLHDQEQYGYLEGPFEGLDAVARAVADEGVASAWSVRAPAGNSAAAQVLPGKRQITDAAIDGLRTLAPDLDGRVGVHVRDAVAGVLSRLDTLEETRRLVDGGRDPGGVFGAIATDALDGASRVARAVQDRVLSARLGAIIPLAREQVAVAGEAEIVVAFLAGERDVDVNAWVASIARQDVQAQAFDEISTRPQRVAYRESGADIPTSDPVRGGYGIDLPRPFPRPVMTPSQYFQWFTVKQETLTLGIDAVQQAVNEEASARESSTRWEAIAVSLGTAALVLVVLVLAWMVVRSVNRRLRRLTRAARDVSERRLPRLVDTLKRGGEVTAEQIEELTPVGIGSKDEIGALTRAVDTIQRVTVSVAEEQAAFVRKGIGDLFVNLARRNQSLLDRQLSLLDELETSAGTDELAALFDLDHLATRMRRNAESLLVLSGAEHPRQRGHAVAVIDAVRAAAAEIVDFARLSYFGFESDHAVVGHAVSDVTHLIAELLENATAFSPPDSPVVVTGRMVEDRYVVTITDEGIGIGAEQLAAANTLLAHPPAPGLTLSRTLGLHVVAHLGARLAVQVQLRPTPSRGITAVVVLPAALLTRVESPAGLTARVPGAHLTHVPDSVTCSSASGSMMSGSGRAADATTASEGDARPRPDRVHDLLASHERGKRDGRVRAADEIGMPVGDQEMP